MHTLATRAVLLVLLCGAAASIAKTPPVEDQSNSATPAESAYLTRAFIFVDSPEIERYLNTVAQRLLDASDVKLPVPHILIQSSDAFDVFTDSKQNLIIATGALRELSGEDELAAVLGHEISHQILRHPQRKDAVRALPVGLETAGLMSAAADQLHGRSGQTLAAGVSKSGSSNLANTPVVINTQAMSVLWTDVVAPSWNRKQEREADENGLLLMRAAGYDPSAFGTLFQRLHAEQAKRSRRMELLRNVMLARAKQKREQGSSQTGSKTRNVVSAKLDAMSAGLHEAITEAAVDHVMSELTKFSQDYDSPDERQRNLSKFAHEHRSKGSQPAKPASQFSGALRTGKGGSLLKLDAAAIQGLDAMTARDLPAAKSAMLPLLASSVAGNPPAPHLNLALGAWQEVNGHPELGEAHAGAWLAGRRPPANAYVWLASHQLRHKNYGAAIKTLERGRVRVGNGAPFLPHLVSAAKASGEEKRAEQYALECRAEDMKNVRGTMAILFGGYRVPSGLYADCVQRLGHEPEEESGSMQTAKRVVEKVRNKLQKTGD